MNIKVFLYAVNMQILVVGGAGSIGSVVIEELIKNKNINKIIVFDDLSTGFKESVPNKIDLVIHLAAKISVAE